MDIANTTIRTFTEQDITAVVSFYIHYYNTYEDGEWTEETVTKRLCQIISRKDSYGIIMTEGGQIISFALGYFEQFDDGISYNLNEIVVSADYQNHGIGTQMMGELENRVKEMGAFMISLQAVNDDKHDRFYGRLGYGDCTNFVIKVKIL